MFNGLSSLKYVNLINLTDPNNIISNFYLKDLTDLTVCQKEKIFEKATNQCCTFDIEENKCQNILVITIINEISTNTPNEKTTTNGITETIPSTTTPSKSGNNIPNPLGLQIFVIDSRWLRNTGKLTLNGKISGTVSGPIKYTLPLSVPCGISLSCTLADNKSECETDRAINNKIVISLVNITGND